MANTYRALSQAAVAAYEDDVFVREFTVTEEQDALNAGLLEIVPRTYEVLSNNFDAAAQGETFEGAFFIETEAALIAGGHIKRVDTDADLDVLRDEAELAGVKVDKRWGAQRLREEIENTKNESE